MIMACEKCYQQKKAQGAKWARRRGTHQSWRKQGRRVGRGHGDSANNTVLNNKQKRLRRRSQARGHTISKDREGTARGMAWLEPRRGSEVAGRPERPDGNES